MLNPLVLINTGFSKVIITKSLSFLGIQSIPFSLLGKSRVPNQLTKNVTKFINLPTYLYLSSSSGDGTARVWHVPETAIQEYSTDPIVLDHIPSSSDKNNNISENRDVTVIDWHPSGEYLATGSYDGISRIWLRTGELKYAMRKHSGPVFSLKWNKKGDLLLSGSVDRTAIIWDTETGEPRQQFDCHSCKSKIMGRVFGC